MTTPSDGVEVKLGADTSAATSGVGDAASSIAASLKGIQDALQNFGSKNKQVLDDAVKNNANLSRSFLELKGSVTGGFNAIAGVVARFRGVLGTITTALAGGALFKESIASMLNMEDSVRTLEISLGATAERATQLSIALKLAGSNADTFAAMAFRVQMRLNTQADEFDRLGVKVKDSASNFLPMEDILQNIYARMQDFKAGADQNGFALEMVGRQARDFANEMSRLEAVQTRAIELQKQLGIEMGPQRQAEVEGYRIEFNAFKVTLEAIADRIGAAVLPGLMRMADYFNSIGPAAIDAIVIAVKGFLTALELLKSVGVSIITVIAAGFLNLLTIVKSVGEAMYAGITGQWGKIPGIVKNAYGEMKAQTVGAANAIVDTWKTSADRVGKLWSDMPSTPRSTANLPKSGKQHFTPKPQAGGEDDSLMAGLENELKFEQDAYNKRQLLQGSFQTWSIEQTRDYWKAVLDQVELSTNDRMAAENKYYDAERALQIQAFQAYIANLDAQIAAQGKNINAKIALAQKEYDAEVQRYGAQSAQAAEAYKKIAQLRQQLADQVIKIAQLQAAREESIAQHDYDMANLQLTQQVALRNVSAEQQYAIESQLEDRLYALKHAALEKERADAEGDIEKQKEIDNKLLKAEQDYQTKKTQIANAAELERKQYALQAAQDTQNAFSTLLQDLTNHTKTVKQALLDFFNSIQQSLTKLASDQVAKQLFGPGTAGGGFLNNIFGKIFGGGGGAGDLSKTTGINPNGGTLGDAVRGLGNNTQQAGAQAADASLTQLATAATAASTSLSAQFQTAVTTVSTTMQSALQVALDALTAAANSAAAALQSVAASGSGGGGLGGLFGGGGTATDAIDVGDNFAGGIPFYASGTNYVPRDTLAVIHKGEAVIPAAMNRPGVGSSVGMTNNFYVSGPLDSRTQDQMASKFYLAAMSAARKRL